MLLSMHGLRNMRQQSKGTGYMIIRITETTVKAYEHMITPEQLYPLDRPGHYCLGAVTEKDGKETAAGILVFDISEGMIGDESAIAAQIQWLYVEEDFRNQGIGNALMTELYRILNQAEVFPVLCDIPFPEEYNELCAFLEGWGFTFRLIDKYEWKTTLENLKQNKNFAGKKITGQVISLEDLKPVEWNQLHKLLQDEPQVLEILQTKDLYEPQISCVCWKNEKIQSLFLVCRGAEDQLIPELLLGFPTSSSADIYQMLLYALDRAEKNYPAHTQVLISCHTASSANLIAYLFPDAQPELVRRGIYTGDWEEEEEETDGR